ncbi:thioredoxin-like protein [Lasiosphaeria ovina]|uniref:Thioredoxin-like protein n=1 Tax=Lasiosphaeria ovina TaxID=92902 RepID=A0AAE0JSA3_9PEZI|nr:thioredoxin-like protein [Lasiosphaeria ovina]
MSEDALKHISTKAEFDSLLSSTRYVVADFYADWCGPCKIIAPMYAQLARQLSIPSYLAFAKIDVDAVQPVAQEYGISAMPSFLFFKDSKRVAVNGSAIIRGADAQSLNAAALKLGRLAKEKSEAAAAAATEASAEAPATPTLDQES